MFGNHYNSPYGPIVDGQLRRGPRRPWGARSKESDDRRPDYPIDPEDVWDALRFIRDKIPKAKSEPVPSNWIERMREQDRRWQEERLTGRR
jgi:hypothetical protein